MSDTPRTPFEADCERKAVREAEYHDTQARLNTCECGVLRQYHWQEVEAGRCRRFRAMTPQEWAEWLGVGE
jgi:hypothetical protein